MELTLSSLGSSLFLLGIRNSYLFLRNLKQILKNLGIPLLIKLLLCVNAGKLRAS